jgi:predicted ABC-type transport system involved in lysophospholipase L1 biosynthesis ATPase subunit
MKQLITLESVYKSYRRGEVDIPILQGVALEIERGELVALVGASGSGKSHAHDIFWAASTGRHRGNIGSTAMKSPPFPPINAHFCAAQKSDSSSRIFNLLTRTSALEKRFDAAQLFHESGSGK